MPGEKTGRKQQPAGEYHYPEAYGFTPFMVGYIHEGRKNMPAVLVVPGGAYLCALLGAIPDEEDTKKDS